MLRTRVVTAIGLLALFLGLLFFAGAAAWALFAAVIVALGGWEWSRLCGLGRTGRVTWLLTSAVALAAGLRAYLGPSPDGFIEVARASFGVVSLSG